jgi:hypothetical protein
MSEAWNENEDGSDEGEGDEDVVISYCILLFITLLTLL